MTAEWRILVVNPDRTIAGRLTRFYHAKFTPRYNDPGPFEVTFAIDDHIGLILTQAESGIIALRKGDDGVERQVFSGTPDYFTEIWDEQHQEPIIRVTGWTDTVLMSRRIMYPNPGYPFTITNQGSYDTRTGSAESVMYSYVRYNLGSWPNDPARRVPGFSLKQPVDSGLGNSVTGSARYDNLLTFIQGLATTGGVGFRIERVSSLDGSLFYTVYQPRDLSGTIVFSRGRGNLLSYSYSKTQSTGNAGIVGGQGELQFRTITEHLNNPDQAIARKEVFLDRRDTNDPVDHAQAAAEMFAERGEKFTISATVSDTDQIQFGRDYDLGDRITVSIRDTDIVDMITQVTYELTSDGGTAIEKPPVPVVGDWEQQNNLQVFKAVRNLAGRLSRLETRDFHG